VNTKACIVALFGINKETCNQDGICAAVCPSASLSHADIPPESCTPIEKKLGITTEQGVQFVRNRRSIRRYKDKPVDRADLEQLIDIARYAPSGHNSRPVEWLVLGRLFQCGCHGVSARAAGFGPARR